MEPVIEVKDVVTRLGGKTIHDGVSFSLPRGRVVALIASSGGGKSVLLKAMTGLLHPTAGSIRLFGEEIVGASPDALRAVRRRVGMLFQNGALFSSLSVAENVAAPLVEERSFPSERIEDLVALRLSLSGLPPSVGSKMPSELSGGMRKRVALARALALEPELLFLDEPTSGLDPIGARSFDKLVRALCDALGITIFMVTHDLDTLLGIVDTVVVLGDGKVKAMGPVAEVSSVDDPWIREYFSSRVDEASKQELAR